ncbi:MAG: family 10 glycosylhydrolase [Bacteroidia bacterium]|nr:family 10 glycosylhydrolase [Bacteroidia bacterium]
MKGLLSKFFLLLTISIATYSFAGNPPAKEFRGVWIATINNIDWPSAPGLPVAVQKKELRELIERIEKLNLNVVIFQVRPAADAFYPSQTEPWSHFLTGKQGLAPTPFFDPLAYAIELCHSKGMELHAWFNPFRVRNNGHYKLDPHCFAARNPQYTCSFDDKLFFDPGIPQVRNHIVKVIMEVVRKYDIDAIHFDDYFYPYPIKGTKFPDSKTFNKYGKSFYPNRLSDWRRDNINKFITALHDSIKAVKPSVLLGVSPFGVWRNKSDDPNGSPGIKATTSYDDLYADVYKWLANDWIDYIIPQLYWEQGNRFGDFTVLAKWWNDHSFGKPLYLGQALYKSTGKAKVFANPKEISEQISILRNFENVSGFALYSASHLAKLSGVVLTEFNSNLLRTKVDTPHNNRSVVIAQKVLPPQPPVSVPEKVLIADKKTIAEAVNSTYNSLINIELPTPEQFSVTKSRKGWEISWKIIPSVHDNGLKYSVLVFEPVKGGGYLNKVYETTKIKQVFIPRKSDLNPAKVLFGIVSVNDNGYQSPFPKLFKIKGRRIVFN